jgi:formylglycine-generating enzyme required for sulfatase activity
MNKSNKTATIELTHVYAAQGNSVGGNVWQWTSDWYHAGHYSTLAAQGTIARNPQGPSSSLDPSDPNAPK